MMYASYTFSPNRGARPLPGFMVDSIKAYAKSVGLVSRYYPANSTIVRQGDVDHRIFIIELGWSSLSHELPNGTRQLLDFPVKGNLVVPHLSEGKTLDTFTALSPLTVLESPTQTPLRTAMNSAQLTPLFLQALLHQRAIIAQHLTNVGRRSALARTAHLLLELGIRLEKVGVTTEPGYECPLTQYDLADALGLSAIHVNRMLRQLRERGLLDFRSGFVRLLNRHGLAAVAQFDGAYLED